MSRIELVTSIDAPIEVVFDLARSIDAHRESMARSGERALGGITSGLIEAGQQVTWKARHFGVQFTMTSRITEMTPPVRFVDEQVRGPFRRFRHEHHFSEVDGRTRMIDDITFDAPLGLLGKLVDRTVLHGYLERLIRERNRYLASRATS